MITSIRVQYYIYLGKVLVLQKVFGLSVQIVALTFRNNQSMKNIFKHQHIR